MPAVQPPTPAKPTYVKDLSLLFGIPLGIVLIAALIVYVPSLFARPAYGFLYSYCNDYSCSDSYSLDSTGHIQKNSPAPNAYVTGTNQTQLAYYDPAAGSSRTLNENEAQSYRLINSSKSPDGYTLVHSTGDSGFLFWGDYQDSWRLENGLKKKTVHLNGSDQQYSYSVHFIGWVQK